MMTRVGELGAEAIEFGLQCGNFLLQDDRGHGSWHLCGLRCCWVVYVTLSHAPSCRMPPTTCDRTPALMTIKSAVAHRAGLWQQSSWIAVRHVQCSCECR